MTNIKNLLKSADMNMQARNTVIALVESGDIDGACELLKSHGVDTNTINPQSEAMSDDELDQVTGGMRLLSVEPSDENSGPLVSADYKVGGM